MDSGQWAQVSVCKVGQVPLRSGSVPSSRSRCSCCQPSDVTQRGCSHGGSRRRQQCVVVRWAWGDNIMEVPTTYLGKVGQVGKGGQVR